MKISIWGVNAARGAPLAVALRNYGRHSVVGWGTSARVFLDQHPDPEVQHLLGQPTPLPMAPKPLIALREGSDLAVVASFQAASMLELIAVAARELDLRDVPVIVVTPHMPPIVPPNLLVGHAPFVYRPGWALQRLLALPRIAVTVPDAETGRRLHNAVSDAWRWVSNYTKIEEIVH
jgi:hypothetical protein